MFLYDWILHRVSTERLKCIIFLFYSTQWNPSFIKCPARWESHLCSSLWGPPKISLKVNSVCVHCTNWEKKFTGKGNVVYLMSNFKNEKNISRFNKLVTIYILLQDLLHMFFTCIHWHNSAILPQHSKVKFKQTHLFQCLPGPGGWKGEHLV